MPTKASRAKKWLKSGKAISRWSKEGVFYVQLTGEPSGQEVQEMILAIDPGSKFDGYAVSGAQEVALQGMAVLPSRIRKRMETRSMLRRSRRGRNCRRREARFNNRKKKAGWIAPSQLAKVQLRIRLMERLCGLFPITDIVIEDVRFDHFHKHWGKHFSTVEIGKAQAYEAAGKLAKLWLPRGWDTAQARSDYRIKKCSQKDKLAPESHANDAWAMICWFFGEKPENTTGEFYIWRRQECSRRQLHMQNPTGGGKRGRYGGTTYPNSDLRKGDVVRYADKIAEYVGGWRNGGKAVRLIGDDGKRIQQASTGKIEFLARAPHILTERRKAHPSLA